MNEAILKRSISENQKILFPPCNVEWDADRGTRVWCTDKRYKI